MYFKPIIHFLQINTRHSHPFLEKNSTVIPSSPHSFQYFILHKASNTFSLSNTPSLSLSVSYLVLTHHIRLPIICQLQKSFIYYSIYFHVVFVNNSQFFLLSFPPPFVLLFCSHCSFLIFSILHRCSLSQFYISPLPHFS